MISITQPETVELVSVGTPQTRRKSTRRYSGLWNSEHCYSTNETIAFTHLINNTLSEDKLLSHHLPLNVENEDIFKHLDDGLILMRLINIAQLNTIDIKKFNKSKNMNIFQKQENLSVVLVAAKHIGCTVINMGGEDILAGRPTLILGLLWQIIKIVLLNKVNVHSKEAVATLKQQDESENVFMQLSSEQILLRWVSHHLEQCCTTEGEKESSRIIIRNFDRDLSDNPMLFSKLLHQINPNCKLLPSTSTGVGGDITAIDRLEIAEHVLQQARCVLKIHDIFIQPTDLVGNNSKLIMGFVAQLYDASNNNNNNTNNNIDDSNNAMDDGKEAIVPTIESVDNIASYESKVATIVTKFAQPLTTDDDILVTSFNSSINGDDNCVEIQPPPSNNSEKIHIVMESIIETLVNLSYTTTTAYDDVMEKVDEDDGISSSVSSNTDIIITIISTDGNDGIVSSEQHKQSVITNNDDDEIDATTTNTSTTSNRHSTDHILLPPTIKTISDVSVSSSLTAVTVLLDSTPIEGNAVPQQSSQQQQQQQLDDIPIDNNEEEEDEQQQQQNTHHSSYSLAAFPTATPSAPDLLITLKKRSSSSSLSPTTFLQQGSVAYPYSYSPAKYSRNSNNKIATLSPSSSSSSSSSLNDWLKKISSSSSSPSISPSRSDGNNNNDSNHINNNSNNNNNNNSPSKNQQQSVYCRRGLP